MSNGPNGTPPTAAPVQTSALVFGLFTTGNQISIQCNVPTRQALNMLLAAAEDLRLQVFREELGVERRIQVVPSGTVPR